MSTNPNSAPIELARSVASRYHRGDMTVARIFAAGFLMVACAWPADGATAKILKTLPHFLDSAGRHTLHPSLFERDAYQAELKAHPERTSGIRFDVQWKAREVKAKTLRMKLEVRAANTPPRGVEVFESDTRAPAFFSRWTSIAISSQEFNRIGPLIAWRITLWDGPDLLAEQRSFLWEPPAAKR